MVGAGYTIEQVSPETTRPLRQALLKQSSTLGTWRSQTAATPPPGTTPPSGSEVASWPSPPHAPKPRPGPTKQSTPGEYALSQLSMRPVDGDR